MSEDITKVLVIDDHPFFGMDLRYKLEKHPFKVFYAKNGIEGVVKAKEVIPDVCIVDYIMPGMDGVETLKKLRALEVLNHPVLILFTSEAYPQVIKSAVEAGAWDFVIKTAGFDIIFEKIKKALVKRQGLIS